MWQSVTFLILLVGISLNLNVLRASEDDVGNANDYIDEVLQNLRKDPGMISKMDPIQIPDVSESNLEFKNGIVRGLSRLYRHGDCTLEYEESIKVGCEIGARDVSATGKYAFKALFFWIKGDVDAQLDDLALNMQLSSTNGKVNLQSLKVAHLGNYRIKRITGMSVLFNWALKLIANSIAQKSRGRIIDAIEGPAADAIRKELEKIKFPEMSYPKK